MAARSRAWVCGRSLAGMMVSKPAGAWMSVSCVCVCVCVCMYVCVCFVLCVGVYVCVYVCMYVCCVLSSRGVCDGLITRPEDSYRMWCVWV